MRRLQTPHLSQNEKKISSAMLSFSWTTLRGKHCQYVPHCCNGSCRYVQAFTGKLGLKNHNSQLIDTSTLFDCVSRKVRSSITHLAPWSHTHQEKEFGSTLIPNKYLYRILTVATNALNWDKFWKYLFVLFLR